MMSANMPDNHRPVKHTSDGYAQPIVADMMPQAHSQRMKNLQRIRKSQGLSQSELARRVGCNQATISKIERGDNYTYSMATRIAAKLGVAPVDLIGADEIEQRYLAALRNASPARRSAVLLLLEDEDAS